MNAIIMAGGEGSRLRPLTGDIPKPLAPVAGKPCIQHIIDLLRFHEIDEIAATVLYKKETMVKLLTDENVRIFEEKTPLGTAGSVKQCENFAGQTFIVISGDCICDFDLRAAAAYHKSHGGIATLILSEVSNPLEYGVCVTDADGVITRFIEKPAWERAYSGTVNTGVYILSNEIFNFIEKDKKTDFSKDVFPLLMKTGYKIHGFRAGGYWCDIGSLDAYLQCNHDVLAGKVRIPYPVTKRIRGASLTRPCYVGKNVIAKGASIGAYTSVGDNVTIKSGAHVEKSVLLDGVSVGEGSFIKNAIICQGAQIGKDVSVGDYSVLGSDCIVGDNCVIAARSRIYPKNIIPAGDMVSGMVTHTGKEYDIYEVAQSPEAFIRLGRSMSVTEGKNLCMGGEESESLFRRQALSSGILSEGASLTDFGECDKNVFSYIVRKGDFDGGVYIGCDRIYFIENDGLPSSQTKIKNLEKNLSVQPETSACGEYRVISGYMPIYEDKLKKHLMGIGNVPFFVYGPDFFTNMFITDPGEYSERVYIGDEVGVDEYAPETVMNALCYVFGKTYGRVYIPYSYPSTAEKIAKDNGFEVIRITLEDEDRRKLYDICDPNVAGAVLLRYLTKKKMTFKELSERLPSVAVVTREVFGTDEKCNIMKRLLNIPAKKRELVEGIKFIDSDAAVQIVPRNDLHGFKVIAQARNTEAADAICDFYVNKIKMVDNEKE